MTSPNSAANLEIVDRRRGPVAYILDGRDIDHPAWLELRERELRLWLILAGACRGNAHGWSYSRERLAKRCGMSTDSVDRATVRLEALHFIKRIRRYLAVPAAVAGELERNPETGALSLGFQVANLYELRSPCEEYGDEGIEVLEVCLIHKGGVLPRDLRVIERQGIRKGVDKSPFILDEGGRTAAAHTGPRTGPGQDPDRKDPPFAPRRDYPEDLVDTVRRCAQHVATRAGVQVAELGPADIVPILEIMRGKPGSAVLGIRPIPRQYAKTIRSRDVAAILDSIRAPVR